MFAATETETPIPNEPLAQGDVVVLPDRTAPPHLGVILNADCDLANGKTDGVISYLPIYSFSEYLEAFWFDSFASAERVRIVSAIHDIVGDGDFEKDAIVGFLQSDDRLTVCESLVEDFSLQRKEAQRLHQFVEEYENVFADGADGKRVFATICKRKPTPSAFAKKQITSAFKGVGDGHLMINEIVGKSELGYLIRMRRIYSIPETDCFQSEKDLRISGKSSDGCAFRVARLSAAFKFKFAQQFASQFSRVGLPDEFAHMRPLVIDELAEKVVGDQK